MFLDTGFSGCLLKGMILVSRYGLSYDMIAPESCPAMKSALLGWRWCRIHICPVFQPWAWLTMCEVHVFVRESLLHFVFPFAEVLHLCVLSQLSLHWSCDVVWTLLACSDGRAPWSPLPSFTIQALNPCLVHPPLVWQFSLFTIG